MAEKLAKALVFLVCEQITNCISILFGNQNVCDMSASNIHEKCVL